MTEFDSLTHDRLGQDLAAYLDRAADPDLAQVILALARAAVPIASFIARGPLAVMDGGLAKALEGFADDSFANALGEAPVRAFVTVEREAPTPANPRGCFLVALDPIDRSSNLDANVTIGSIFSVLDAPSSGAMELADGLQAGHRQRAAGFVVYGPHISLVFTLGAGTHAATLDPNTGAFAMTALDIHVPENVPQFAINAANARHWPGPVRAYVDDCLMGETGPRAKNFDMRWTGSLAAEAYRILRRGGVYLYPDDARAGHEQGRIRLLFEANPIALLIEQAGGLAIDGVNRILDVPIKSLEMRTPLIFGSTDKIERIRDYYVDGFRSAARSPLFGKRGLLRG